MLKLTEQDTEEEMMEVKAVVMEDLPSRSQDRVLPQLESTLRDECQEMVSTHYLEPCRSHVMNDSCFALSLSGVPAGQMSLHAEKK